MSSTAGLVIGLMFVVMGLLLFDDVVPSAAAIVGGLLLIVGSALRPGTDE